jgi:hypothetical protein
MAETTTQQVIQREAPDIEAYKIGLMEQAKALTSTEPTGGLPSIQIAGLDPYSTQARTLANTGLGSYSPFVAAGNTAVGSGLSNLQAAQQNLNTSFAPATTAVAGIPSTTQAGMQSYDPNSAVANYMNPFQSAVTQNNIAEIRRQNDITRQQRNAAAVNAGAFGGSRQGIANAEADRNMTSLMNDQIAKDNAANYAQAQTSAMNQFNNQQGRQLQGSDINLRAGLGLGSLAQQLGQTQLGYGGTMGQLGVQQAGIGELNQNMSAKDIDLMNRLGIQSQQLNQQQLDATRQGNLQNIYEPYQRLSYYSDILRGAPSSQQTLSSTTAPSPSLLNQVVGAGIGGIGAYNAAQKSGII